VKALPLITWQANQLYYWNEMKKASRASHRLSRVLVLDEVIDARTKETESRVLLRRKSVVGERWALDVDGDLRPLPPKDRGHRAYMFLLTAFIIEAVMWGKSYFFHLMFLI
jgi:hypothetical protein